MPVPDKIRALASKVGRVLERDPERVASAWRRLLYAGGPSGSVPRHILDDVVESFVRELGATLGGASGRPWARTRGVLRLSPQGSLMALHQEISALHRCLLDAVDVLDGPASDREAVDAAIEEARSSVIALQVKVMEPLAPPVVAPVDIVVLEYFERATSPQPRVRPPATAPAGSALQ